MSDRDEFTFQMFDREGNELQIPAVDAESRLVDNTHAFRRGMMVSVGNVRTGQKYKVPAENLRRMLMDGGGTIRLLTPEVASHLDTLRDHERAEWMQANMAEAVFGAGVARGLDPTGVAGIFGVPSLSQTAMEAVGGEGTLRAVADASDHLPDHALAGEVTGLLGGMAAGGAAQATRAVTGQGAASTARAIGSGSLGGLTARVGDSIRLADGAIGQYIASPLARRLTAGAAEGAIAHVPIVTQGEIMRDREITSELVLTETGLGAILGLGAEGAFALGGRALSAMRPGERMARRGMHLNERFRAAQDMANPNPQGVHIAGRSEMHPMVRVFDDAALLGGAAITPPEVIRAFSTNPNEWTAAVRRAATTVPNAARNLARMFQRLDDTFEEGAVGFIGSARRARINNMLADMGGSRQLSNEAADLLNNLRNRLRDLDVGAGADDVNKSTRLKFIKGLGETIDTFSVDATVTGDGGISLVRQFELLERVARNIDGLHAEKLKSGETRVIMKDASKAIRERMLSNADYFGEAGREFERMTGGIGRTIENFNYLRQNFTSTFTRDGKTIKRFDPGKFQEYLENLATAKSDVSWEVLDDVMRRLVQFEDEFGEQIISEGGRATRVSDVVSDAIAARNLMIQAEEDAVRNYYMVGATRLETQFSGAGGVVGIGGGTAGIIAAGLGAGPVGAAAAGAIAGGAIALAFRPLSTMVMGNQIRESTKRFLSRFGEATHKLNRLWSGGKPGGFAGRTVPALVHGFREGSKEERRALYNERVQEIREIASNPALLMERLELSLANFPAESADLAEYMASSAARGIMYLNDTIPPADAPSPFADDVFQASDAEIDVFLNRIHALEDPMWVYEGLITGETTPEAVEAVTVAFPRIKMEFDSAVLEVAGHNRNSSPPYALKVQLSSLLDVPLDSSFTTEFQIYSQSNFAQTSSQARTLGRAVNSPNLATDTFTEFQMLGTNRR